MKSFIQSNWLTIVSIFICFVISWYFYRKGKLIAKPVYLSKTQTLLGHNNSQLPPEITVNYKDQEIDTLAKEFIVFWNNGSNSLEKNMVVEHDKVRIQFDESVTILDKQILKRTNDSNRVSLIQSDNSNEIYINFDFLHPKDGVVIELLYSGTLCKPEIKGSIIGVPQGVVKLNKYKAVVSESYFMKEWISISGYKPSDDYFRVVSSILGLFLVIAYFDPMINFINSTILKHTLPPSTHIVAKITFSAVFLTVIILDSLKIWSKYVRYPRKLSHEQFE